MDIALCILIGYLFGCVNMSYIIGKIKGFDIRERGSNNAGASNAVITMGFKVGVIVGLWDILKAFLSAVIARKLFPNTKYAFLYAGSAAVMGHIFPFWMRFHGGKGLASVMGLILAHDWRIFLVFGAVIIAVTLITDYIALGTLATAVGYPIYAILVCADLSVTIAMVIVSVTMICKHIVNIKRMINHQELGLSQTLGKKKR